MKIILPFTIIFVLLAIFALICWLFDDGKVTPNLIVWFVGVFVLWYGGILVYVHNIMNDPVTKVMEAEHATLIDQQALQEVDCAQMLLDVVEELALAYGMEKPAVYIVEDAEYPNAFAVGDEFDSGVAVTRPLLDMCSRSELSGVLGHELAHIKSEDSETTLLFTLFVSSLAFVTTVGYILVRIAPSSINHSDDDDDDSGGIIALIFLFGFVLMIAGTIAKLCALLLRFAVSRTREYDADAMSAKINQSPKGLIDALNEIEEWQGLQETDSDVDEDDDKLFNKPNHHRYSALYFTDDHMIKHSFWEFHKLFDDHPATNDRIERLKDV